jgi:hypothetical protein
MYSFIRNHFNVLIESKTTAEKHTINVLLAKIFYDQEEPAAVLQEFNISENKKHVLIDQLSLERGKDFIEDSSLITYIYNLLALRPGQSHITKLYTTHNLSFFLGPLTEADANEPITLVPRAPSIAFDYRVVSTRFNLLTPTSITLDLSDCHLDSLSLNDLHMLLRQVQYLPQIVLNINLSQNGLDHNLENLKILLQSLPLKIKDVILDGHPGALSPIIQLARLTWPASYQFLVQGAKNDLDAAKRLFGDYTKGNSRIARFFYLHWNRHHVAIVNNILFNDDSERLYPTALSVLTALRTELTSQSDGITQLSNPCGSLERRMAFFRHHLYTRSIAAAAAPVSPTPVSSAHPIDIEMASIPAVRA